LEQHDADDGSMQCTISEEMDNFQHYFLRISLSQIMFYATIFLTQMLAFIFNCCLFPNPFRTCWYEHL